MQPNLLYFLPSSAPGLDGKDRFHGRVRLAAEAANRNGFNADRNIGMHTRDLPKLSTRIQRSAPMSLGRVVGKPPL